MAEPPPSKRQRPATEQPAPAPVVEQDPAKLERFNNERRALLGSVVGSLPRETMEKLLIGACLNDSIVMQEVIDANANSRKQQAGKDVTFKTSPRDDPFITISGVPVPISKKNAASRPSVQEFAAQYQPALAATSPLPDPTASPKSTSRPKPTRPYSTKRFPGRGPGRWPRGMRKDGSDMANGGPSTNVRERRSLPTKVAYNEDDDDDEVEEDDEGEDNGVRSSDEEFPVKKKRSAASAAVAPPLARVRPTGKESMTVDVGILKGASNVVRAGFDRRMYFNWRVSKYDRDGNFVGIVGRVHSGPGVKRHEVDLHPTLASLSEDEFRNEVLRRQYSVGFRPPSDPDPPTTV